MRKGVAIVAGLCLLPAANATDQPVSIKSTYDVDKTAERFETLLQDNGIKIVERTIKLRDAKTSSPAEEVILFNNPYIVTYEGRCRWSDVHHRPLQARIWQDQAGAVWVTYRVPKEKVNRFGIIECGKVKDDIKALMERFATAAAGL